MLGCVFYSTTGHMNPRRQWCSSWTVGNTAAALPPMTINDGALICMLQQPGATAWSARGLPSAARSRDDSAVKSTFTPLSDYAGSCNRALSLQPILGSSLLGGALLK